MEYSDETRPVNLSEQDIQTLAWFVDTNPDRDEAIDLINRMLAEWKAAA